MSGAIRRIEKLETGLTPKYAILLWLQEAHATDIKQCAAAQVPNVSDDFEPFDLALHSPPAQGADGTLGKGFDAVAVVINDRGFFE